MLRGCWWTGSWRSGAQGGGSSSVDGRRGLRHGGGSRAWCCLGGVLCEVYEGAVVNLELEGC